jgi:hypothetical protein
MRCNRDWAAQADPDQNPQFRRRWLEPPRRRPKRPRERLRVWRRYEVPPKLSLPSEAAE